jgi:hypothetical protein
VNNIYSNLAERLRGELADLEQVVSRALQSWSLIQKTPQEQFAFVDSVALNLHSLYSGLERLFELIARQIDRDMPESGTWHRDLLEQMAQDIPDTRPAVLSRETASATDEFRRFRHLVRNVYALELAPGKMAVLMATLPELWPKIRAELLAFADFMDALDTSIQKDDAPQSD